MARYRIAVVAPRIIRILQRSSDRAELRSVAELMLRREEEEEEEEMRDPGPPRRRQHGICARVDYRPRQEEQEVQSYAEEGVLRR